MAVREFSIWVPGKPRGYMRPSTTASGRRYKHKKQEEYEDEIIMAWRRGGSLRLEEGPYLVECTAIFQAPKGWRLKDGSLSADARRRPYPDQVPDVDNLLKQIDVLVAAKAIPGDERVIGARTIKRWQDAAAPDPGLSFRFTTLMPA